MEKIEQFINSIPKPVKVLWILFFSIMLVLSLSFIYISNFLLPDTKDLENPKYEIASQILSADGQELGKAFKFNREWLTYKEINPKIIKALIATEDVRFFNHCGIDFRGTLRAVVYLTRKGGASTITQQLAKQFFTQRSSSRVKRIWQKLKEWVIAVEFEKRYTKEEILAMYLNKYDFLYGAIGIGTAAKTYFGKNQKDLTYDEAAILIGMLKNPYIYNPKVNPEKGAARRKTVLGQLLKNKDITEAEYKKLVVKKIDMTNFNQEVYYTGVATYFRAELIKYVKGLLEEDQYKKPDGTKYNIYTDGLKIYTTIDFQMQKYAEEAAKEHMINLQKKYFNVWNNKDPWISGDPEQVKLRNNNLFENFRQTSRFKELRSKYLSSISEEILSDLPENARLNDNDVFKLFEIDKNKKLLDKYLDEGKISAAQRSNFEEILNHPKWPTFKVKWEALRKEAQAIFEKPVSMKIFDYVTNSEKVVVMSPKDSIKHHQKHLQIGSVGVDPKTGNVKIWIGGINHKYFQFDHVTSNRQIGSTFKPFIYATAIIEQAISPCFKVQDVKQCIPANDPDFGLMTTWCPDNADGKYTGTAMTLKEGLKESKNTISVYLMKQLGSVEVVRNFVSNLGIDKNKIPKGPSICLGTPELSALDLAGAYTAFANNGIYSKPNFITHITDKDGKLIYQAINEQKKVINPSYNKIIVELLRYVAKDAVQPKFKSKVGGKTGTTNNYKDGWYVGFTPEIVVSTWVGGDVEWIRFNTLNDGQGAVMARPFFEKFLSKVEKDPKVKYNPLADFISPDENIVEWDCTKYENPNTTTPEKANNPKSDEFEDEDQ